MPRKTKSSERREKARFSIRRDLYYAVTSRGRVLHAGRGRTVNIGSRGIAFRSREPLEAGGRVVLSISWPAMREDSCPLSLSVIGRVIRSHNRLTVCSLDKYEFRAEDNLAVASAENAQSRRMSVGSDDLEAA